MNEIINDDPIGGWILHIIEWIVVGSIFGAFGL